MPLQEVRQAGSQRAELGVEVRQLRGLQVHVQRLRPRVVGGWARRMSDDLRGRALRVATEAAGISLEEAKLRYPAIWTIYHRPADIPRAVVVRCRYGLVADPYTFMTSADDADAIERARAYCISCGASVPLARDPSDSPSIVESWI